MKRGNIEVLIDSITETGIDRKIFEAQRVSIQNVRKSFIKRVKRRLNLLLLKNENVILNLFVFGILIFSFRSLNKYKQWDRERKVLEVQIFLLRCLQLVTFFQRKNKDKGMELIMRFGYVKIGVSGIEKKLK